METPPIYKRVGLEIANRRKALGLTQLHVSAAVGISRAALANIERGEQRVFFDQLVGICAYLGIRKVDHLLDSDGQQSAQRSESSNTPRISGAALSRHQRGEVRTIIQEITGV